MKISTLIYIAFFLAIFVPIDTKLIESPQILIWYFPLLILLPILIYQIKGIQKDILNFFFFIFIVGLYSILVQTNTPAYFFKVFLNVFIVTYFFYLSICYLEFDINKIYIFYIKGAFFISILLIFQHICKIIGFSPGVNFWYLGVGYNQRNAVLSDFNPAAFYVEPSNLASGLAPALFLAVYNLISKQAIILSKKKSFVIILAILISTSSTAFFSFFTAILIILFNRVNIRAILMTGGTIILSFLILYNTVPKFKLRVDTSLIVFSGEKSWNTGDISQAGSSLILYKSFDVALKSVENNPLLGGGIGSHPVSHEKYNKFKNYWWSKMNIEDGNSLFIRILSEFGLIGCILLLIFLIKNYVSEINAISPINWIIASGILTLIITDLLRNGHYTNFGLTLFFLMYYYNKKINNAVN